MSKTQNPPQFDDLKYENLTNALYVYDTYLAFCETDAEWKTVMRLFDRIRKERDEMLRAKILQGEPSDNNTKKP